MANARHYVAQLNFRATTSGGFANPDDSVRKEIDAINNTIQQHKLQKWWMTGELFHGTVQRNVAGTSQLRCWKYDHDDVQRTFDDIDDWLSKLDTAQQILDMRVVEDDFVIYWYEPNSAQTAAAARAEAGK